MTIVEYEIKFTKLSYFAPELVATEEMKAKQFLKGLRPDIRLGVRPLRLETYSDIVSMAQVI